MTKLFKKYLYRQFEVVSNSLTDITNKKQNKSMSKNIEIPIKGMTCAACAQAVQRALAKLKGVVKAEVNLLSEKATVEVTEEIDIKRVVSIVRATGYDIGKTSIFLQVNELDQDLARLIEEKLTKLDGILEVKTDIVNKNIRLSYIPTLIDEKEILSVFRDLSVKAKKYADKGFEYEEKKKEFAKLKRDLILSFIFTLPIFLGSMFNIPLFNNGYLQMILATFVQFVTGWRFHRLAFIALKHGQANMNSLVSLGTNAAYFYSLLSLITLPHMPHLYFETSAVIITLILFGRTLEERAKTKTSDAIQRLIQMQPKMATVIRDGKEIEISIEEVKFGDSVLVKQSESIPVDGTILEGTASIDESMITGESIPVEKSVSDKVISGTILISGVIKVKAEAVGKESLLSQIIKLIEEAQTGKPPVQRLADKISAIFVPIVLVISLITFLLWFVFGKDLSLALSNAISVLIIACPCALGLATPTAIMVATGRSASQGILLRNVEKLEEINKIEILFSDKTGTLTIGKPEVKEVKYFGNNIQEILKLTASAEKYSEHPLGKAIIRHCMRQGVSIDEPLHFEVIAGGGLFAKVMDSQNIEREILIGSEKLMIKNKILLPEILDDEPVTKVYVAIDGKIVAVFSITDPLREETLEIVNDLKKMGIKIVILTGDNERTAQAVAKKLGIEEYFAGVLPNEKAKVVRKFRVEKRKIVGMIGDGINDAPALAESNIGIAMGGGTDIAIHTADVTLIKGGLKGVPSLIRLSKLTLKTIKENLFWAFIYNIVGIPIAAGVLYIFGGPLLNPMIASLAMSLSSVSVVSNSLRLKRRSGKEFF